MGEGEKGGGLQAKEARVRGKGGLGGEGLFRDGRKARMEEQCSEPTPVR